MSNQFISPNWHPLLIHYPIAFLTAGILIELFSFLWPRGFFRAAGRWMILLGALTSVPALAAGIYAFRTAVGGSGPWYKVLHQATWNSEQWQYMRLHVWMNSIGVGVVLTAVATWVAASDLWRRRLYFPVLLALLCGMGLFAVASWYGGESVYRFGTAVSMTPAQTAGAPSAKIEQLEQSHPVEHGPAAHDVKWYVPPLELHIVLAGVLAALMVGALALTVRRLEPPVAQPEPAETIAPGDTGTVADGPVAPVPLEEIPVATEQPLATTDPVTTTHNVYPAEPTTIFAGRFWLLAFLAAAATSMAGVWSVIDYVTRERFDKNWHELTHPDGQYRLVAHALAGSCLIVLALILSLAARFGRRRRGFTGALLVLAVFVLAVQFWLGIVLYYDGHKGPLYRFSPSAIVQ